MPEFGILPVEIPGEKTQLELALVVAHTVEVHLRPFTIVLVISDEASSVDILAKSFEDVSWWFGSATDHDFDRHIVDSLGCLSLAQALYSVTKDVSFELLESFKAVLSGKSVITVTCEVFDYAFLDRFVWEAHPKASVGEWSDEKSELVFTLALLAYVVDQVNLTLDALIACHLVNLQCSFNYWVQCKDALQRW